MPLYIQGFEAKTLIHRMFSNIVSGSIRGRRRVYSWYLRCIGLGGSNESYTQSQFGRPYLMNGVYSIGRSYSSENTELRKKRILFRAMNTGMKELDLILSEFIKANPDVIEDHLCEFESFLDMETCTIYDIVMGKRIYEEGNQMVNHIKSFVKSSYK